MSKGQVKQGKSNQPKTSAKDKKIKKAAKAEAKRQQGKPL